MTCPEHIQGDDTFVAVLLCGGKGTRLESLTDGILPKSLVKILGKELIHYSLEPIFEHHEYVSSIVFAVDHLGDVVMDWVRSCDIPVPYGFSQQTEPGVIGGISAAISTAVSEHYILCNTDEIRHGVDLSKTTLVHLGHQALGTIVSTETNRLHRHRVLSVNEDGYVVGSQLKGPQFKDDEHATGYVNTGLLAIDRPAVDLVDTNTHGHDWSALINPLHDAGQLVAHIDPRIRYFNVGTPEEYAEAAEQLAKAA